MHPHCIAIFCLTEINTRLYFDYICTHQKLYFFAERVILQFYNVMDFLIFFVFITNVAGKHFEIKC